MLLTANYGYLNLDDIVQVYNPSDVKEPVDWDFVVAVRFGSQVVSGNGITDVLLVDDDEVKDAIRDHCENPAGMELSLEGIRGAIDALPDKIKSAFGGGGLGSFFAGKS